MLHTKVIDDSYMCGRTSVLPFSWNGIMLRDAVMLHSNFLHLVATSTCFTVMSRYNVKLHVCAHLSSQCRYFTVKSKGCFAPRLQIRVTYVDIQMCCNFQGMVQCYIQMLHIVVMLRSNFLRLVNLLQTALVTRRSLRPCHIMVLH